MEYLTAEHIKAIHDDVINDNELQGEAPQKSIEAIIDRIVNRMNYGLINDIFDLAACYGAYIAIGHAFNDANKRTAFAAMNIILARTNVTLSYNTYETEEAGDMIIKIVLKYIDEKDLANWLRKIDN